MLETLFNDFIRCAESEHLYIEGIAVGEENRVLLEHHFTPDLARNIYSHTKSYMATAVGIATAQGKLTLEDRLADYFPESLPDEPDERLGKITLRHLLTMSSGFNRPYLMNMDRRAGVGVPDAIYGIVVTAISSGYPRIRMPTGPTGLLARSRPCFRPAASWWLCSARSTRILRR